MESLNPHQRPPDGIRNTYKRYQKMKLRDLSQEAEILKFDEVPIEHMGKLEIIKELDSKHLINVFEKFAGSKLMSRSSILPLPVYEHNSIPGKT